MRLLGVEFLFRAITSPDRPDGYLLRWEVRLPWFGIKVHRFLRSDAAPLHDHPWSFVSVILWGKYVEYVARTPAETTTPTSIHRGWLSAAFRRAETRHRVELVADRPCWTVCLSGPRRREWFFYPVGEAVVRVPWRVLVAYGEQQVSEWLRQGWPEAHFNALDLDLRARERATS